jgi:hypothetical protein
VWRVRDDRRRPIGAVHREWDAPTCDDGGRGLGDGPNSIGMPFLALVRLSNHIVYKELPALFVDSPCYPSAARVYLQCPELKAVLTGTTTHTWIAFVIHVHTLARRISEISPTPL